MMIKMINSTKKENSNKVLLINETVFQKEQEENKEQFEA